MLYRLMSTRCVSVCVRVQTKNSNFKHFHNRKCKKRLKCGAEIGFMNNLGKHNKKYGDDENGRRNCSVLCYRTLRDILIDIVKGRIENKTTHPDWQESIYSISHVIVDLHVGCCVEEIVHTVYSVKWKSIL